MQEINFDIFECFTTGKSGPIELGKTSLDDLAQLYPPELDMRKREGDQTPNMRYTEDPSSTSGTFEVFDTFRDAARSSSIWTAVTRRSCLTNLGASTVTSRSYRVSRL